ncbi:hypothetical protein [Pseudoalteromonas sp. OOF1S-7]|nr:hypothetical protein [Pseudoalteromonas sp. OOF1S-7]
MADIIFIVSLSTLRRTKPIELSVLHSAYKLPINTLCEAQV